MGLPTAAASLSERAATRLRGETARAAAAQQRVLVIARHFPPCRFVGAQATAQIARYLPPYGWHPVILTVGERHVESSDPNDRRSFPGTIVRTGVLPHPLSFYSKVKASARPVSKGGPGTEPASSRPGRIRRWVLSILQTPDAYTGWIAPATIAGLRAIHRWRITHLFSSAPFWTNHLVGLVLAHLTGLPWTAHLRDPWTQVPPPKPTSALSRMLERWLERLVMTRADFVVCVTERHTRLLREAFPQLPAEKFITIPNGYDEAEWSGSERRALPPRPPERREFVISYTGSLYMGRSPRPLFRALRRLINAADLRPEELRVDLLGFCDTADGVRVSDMAAECGLTGCVHVGPPLSRPDALRRMAASDLLLLLQESWSLQVPGKTYEYLRAGRPILALTSDGALADLLRETGGAWVVEPTDDAAIAAAVREAYRAWKSGLSGPAAEPALVAAFDRRVLTGRLAALFDPRSGPSAVSLG